MTDCRFFDCRLSLLQQQSPSLSVTWSHVCGCYQKQPQTCRDTKIFFMEDIKPVEKNATSVKAKLAKLEGANELLKQLTIN